MKRRAKVASPSATSRVRAPGAHDEAVHPGGGESVDIGVVGHRPPDHHQKRCPSRPPARRSSASVATGTRTDSGV